MSAPRHVVVLGDVVLDTDVDGTVERLCPDAPVPVLDVTGRRHSPGGAGLTALLCAESGARVTLVAPIADDDGGRRLTERLSGHVALVPIGHDGGTRTKVRVRSSGQSLVRVDEGGPGSPRDVPRAAVRELLRGADVVLVSDYGAGVTRDPVLRDLVAEAARERVVVWDPHPRGGDPVPGVTLVTPNVAEATRAADGLGAPGASGGPPDVLASALCAAWDVRAVAVTAGAVGAFVAGGGGEPVFVPAAAAPGGDPCGAGDRFAASAAVALASGALVTGAVSRAVADASAWVAAGGAEGYRRRQVAPAGGAAVGDAVPAAGAASDAATGDGPPAGGERAGGVLEARPGGVVRESVAVRAGAPTGPEDLERLAARLRAGGRSLVATGGCFDIVHAGHVATLQAARRLGDALVVLLNSDASVRRLKGPARPVVTAADRARVLEAFDCVDAVVVFDDDDPRATLGRLRPDVWAKGGDYGGAPLPEADVVREHGGRVVLLPYLGGRSTTSILERAAPTG